MLFLSTPPLKIPEWHTLRQYQSSVGTVLYVCKWDADAKDGPFGDMTLPQPEVMGA